MRDVISFFKGLFIITGAASIVVIITGLFYADGKLHATANGHKYGPARHLAFFSDIIHRSSREIDRAAIAAYNNAVTEDALFYDSLQDARDDHAKSDKEREQETIDDKRRKNGPAHEDIITAPVE